MSRFLEIGSEFPIANIEQSDGITFPFPAKDHLLTFSGRTAIETILSSIKVRKALLPSYCCESILVPFKQAGIEISFFDVTYQDGLHIDLKVDEDVDLLFWCNYFGFHHAVPDLREFKSRGGVVIEDVTHSFFSKQVPIGDYIVASLRKWEPLLCGGYCGSLDKTLNHLSIKRPPNTYLFCKRAAMELKKDYLESGKASLKSKYLQLFKESNQWVGNNYSGLQIDEYSEAYLNSVNIKQHIKRRRDNAKRLYYGLNDVPYIHFLFQESYMDCPLFVPIVVQREFRDIVQNGLIKRGIYCPVHWPHPDASCESNLYDIELSLVCDHRYDAVDMDIIVSAVREIVDGF